QLPFGPGDRWALALRAALVVVLCLTLLRPTLPRWVDRMNVVFLLDLSDSVSLASRERAYRFVAEAGKHMKSGDRNSVITFGEQAVVVWSHRDTEGRLSLFRNGEFLGSQVVRLTAGKNVFSYRQSLDASGIHVYQAAMEVEGDTIEDNNRAVGAVVVRGRPQVLLA